MERTGSKRFLEAKPEQIKDSLINFDINQEIQENSIILKPIYFILVDTQPEHPVFKVTYILKEGSKKMDNERSKTFLKKIVMNYYLDSELKTKKHTYWIFKTKEKHFFMLDKFFQVNKRLKLNYKVKLGGIDVSAGLLLEESKLAKMNFFYNNKSLNNGGFSICSFFLLNSLNNPFKQKRNVFETSYIKEELAWELVPRRLLEQIDKSFQGNMKVESVLPSRFQNMKKLLQIRESVNFFEHLLFRDSLVDAFLDGQEYYHQIWEQTDKDFLAHLDSYVNQNKNYFKIDISKWCN